MCTWPSEPLIDDGVAEVINVCLEGVLGLHMGDSSLILGYKKGRVRLYRNI
jgi:hypothetical protein